MEHTRPDFFSLPLEVRHAIHAAVLTPKLKLCLLARDGRVKVTPCLGANLREERVESRCP